MIEMGKKSPRTIELTNLVPLFHGSCGVNALVPLNRAFQGFSDLPTI